MLLANTIEKYNLFDKLTAPKHVSCDHELPWEFGESFVTHLKMNKMSGLSGFIEFDQKTGYRKNTTLTIVDKSRNGVDLVS